MLTGICALCRVAYIFGDDSVGQLILRLHPLHGEDCAMNRTFQTGSRKRIAFLALMQLSGSGVASTNAAFGLGLSNNPLPAPTFVPVHFGNSPQAATTPGWLPPNANAAQSNHSVRDLAVTSAWPAFPLCIPPPIPLRIRHLLRPEDGLPPILITPLLLLLPVCRHWPVPVFLA